MGQRKIGMLMAYIPPQAGKKGYSLKMGNVMEKDDHALSMKIDMMPLPSSGWEGWCNIWLDKDKDNFKKPDEPSTSPGMEDDIPF